MVRVADLLRAFQVLAPTDDETREAIALLLGNELPVTAEAKPFLPRLLDRKDATSQAPAQPTSASVHFCADFSATQASGDEVRATLVLDNVSPRRPLDWLKGVDPLPLPEASEFIAPVPDSLLVPTWTRSILGSALATLSGNGPLDMERLVRGVAHGIPLRRVPRRSLPTLAKGVQMLVDKSDTMLPFASDQDDLLRQVEAVVGRERLAVLHFEGCPSWGAGVGLRSEWKDYLESHRPPRGTSVLLVTDLGIGGNRYGRRSATPAEWHNFAEQLYRHGCPVVAMVPYGQCRWPPELTRCIKLLAWDRTTSTQTVRRVIGKALLVPGAANS
jgi:hypothetical protein